MKSHATSTAVEFKTSTQPTVDVEPFQDYPALKMTWQHRIDEMDVASAFQKILLTLNLAPEPLMVIVDLRSDPRFPLRATLRAARSAFTHPMLGEWLVIGSNWLARAIERTLSSATGRKNVRWFDTEAQVIDFIESVVSDKTLQSLLDLVLPLEPVRNFCGNNSGCARLSCYVLLFVAAAMMFFTIDQSGPAAGAEATDIATQTITSPLPIQFKGVDDWIVLGLYYPAPQTPVPALLLLHSKDSWSPWAMKWNALGFNVFAIDLRDIMQGDPVVAGRKSEQDIVLVIQQISGSPNVTAHQVAVLGGSFFGAEALVACAKSAECKTAILLSETDYKADLDDPIRTLGNRPLFIAVSKNEGSITDTDLDYARRALGVHQIVVFDGAAHATGLLSAHPELVDMIGDWPIKYLLPEVQTTATP